MDIYKEKDPEANVLLHDLTKPLPFPDNYFDKVACNNVLYTLSKNSRLRTLKEFKRVMEPGEYIVVSDPHKGFKPFEIYKRHLKKEKKLIGTFRLLIKIFSLIVPTLKMFYYNKKIKNENKGGNYNFTTKHSQINDFKEASFSSISKIKKVYANQGYLSKAVK